MEMDDYGVLGLSWKTCSKAGEIYERCERYFHLLSNTYVFKVEKEGAFSKIYLFRSPYRRGVALSNEATFSASVVVLKAMTELEVFEKRCDSLNFEAEKKAELVETFKELINIMEE